MWFQDFVTVFNQSYNCQTSHCLGRNRPPNARLSILLFDPWFRLLQEPFMAFPMASAQFPESSIPWLQSLLLTLHSNLFGGFWGGGIFLPLFCPWIGPITLVMRKHDVFGACTPKIGSFRAFLAILETFLSILGNYSKSQKYFEAIFKNICTQMFIISTHYSYLQVFLAKF